VRDISSAAPRTKALVESSRCPPAEIWNLKEVVKIRKSTPPFFFNVVCFFFFYFSFFLPSDHQGQPTVILAKTSRVLARRAFQSARKATHR